uniref:Uncharacterized protein n=1 Tax=Cebus imitator TaxID=2715852 RepID=A0A2K5R9S4_CEBIM
TRTTQKRSASMIQLPPTRSLSQHMGIVGATIQDEIWVGDTCLGSEIFALTSKGFQGFGVSLVFSQKRAGKARPDMVAHAYNPSTLGG